MTILQLPREVFNTIMTFLKTKDRNSVATTCSMFRNDVEDFSKWKLESIITTIGAAIQTDAAAARLPYRHLLWTALTTPLPFTFDVYQGGSTVVLLDTSVDGDNTLLIAESGDSHALCQVWDFSSGQSLQTVALRAVAFAVPAVGGIRHMVQCGNLLVVACYDTLSVWNWSGEQIFLFEGNSFSVESMHAMGDLVYFLYSSGVTNHNHNSDRFTVLDLADPANIELRHALTIAGVAATTTMLSLGDTLLILRTEADDDRSAQTSQFPVLPHSGIYVYNAKSSLEQLSHVRGEYWSIVEVSNAPGTFAALQENRVSFFELREGKLVLISTITLSTKLFSRSLVDGQHRRFHEDYIRAIKEQKLYHENYIRVIKILLVSNKQIFVQHGTYEVGDKKVGVYSDVSVVENCCERLLFQHPSNRYP